MRELKDLIKENPELIEEILTKKGVSFEDVDNLVKLMYLESNIERKSFEIQKNGGNYYCRFTFQKPIKKEEFEEYIRENKINGYNIIKRGDLICEDFGIEFPKSKVKAYFCNPQQ